MPLYEYQCQKCRHRFEKIQKFSDAPLKKCPECGGNVEKLISAPAVHFKGSGFYVTDYANKSNSGESKSGSSSESSKPSDSESSATKVHQSSSDGKESKASSESKPAKSKSEKPSKK